jgi:chromosome segregation ATPase
MTTDISPTVTDEATTTEQVQEQTETVEPLTAKQQYHNAGAEIERLKQELLDKRESIQAHTARIADIQEQHRDAKQAYEAALAVEQNYQAKLERQQALAKIGGPAEQANLQAMQAKHELQAKSIATAIAKRSLEEAARLLEEIPALLADIDQLKANCEQLEHEQSVMKNVERELFWEWGREEQAAFITELSAKQEAFIAQEEVLREARIVMVGMQQTAKERLASWPDLVQEVQEEHFHIPKEEKPQGKSPEALVFEAKIAFMRALGQWGPQCQARLHGNFIAELLALPRPLIAELMHPNSGIWREYYKDGKQVRTNQYIETAEWHIAETKSHRY